MKYNDVTVKLNQNFYLTDLFTKCKITRLGLKSYEVDYLCREGYLYSDLVVLILKFNDKHLFCDFIRKHLLKNCWFS